MNISQNFKAFRKSRNLTQKQLADIIGVSHQMISQIETGFRPPSAKNILDIALALHCTTDEVYGLKRPNLTEKSVKD